MQKTILEEMILNWNKNYCLIHSTLKVNSKVIPSIFWFYIADILLLLIDFIVKIVVLETLEVKGLSLSSSVNDDSV